MDRKSLLFGMGLGVTVVCGILICVYFFSGAGKVSYVPVELSDDEIAERALELGFVSSSDVSGDAALSDANMLLSLFDKGLLLRLDGSFVATEDVVDLAGSLGMVFASDVDNSDAYDEFKVVTIPRGLSSSDIIDLLFDEGVISDRDYFEDLVFESGHSKELQAGVFRFRIGASSEEVLNMIVAR